MHLLADLCIGSCYLSFKNEELVLCPERLNFLNELERVNEQYCGFYLCLILGHVCQSSQCMAGLQKQVRSIPVGAVEHGEIVSFGLKVRYALP